MAEHNVRAVVLAAGKSTRFRTKKSKLLFNICGQAMILYPLRILEFLKIPISLVLGYQAESIEKEIEKVSIKDLICVKQDQQLGTGHAVACTQSTWDQENILILYGDMPLINKELLIQLFETHRSNNATLTFMTSYVIDPTGYGRVVAQGNKFHIIEEKDCTDQQRQINCINAGIYVIKTSFLREYISKIDKSVVSGEFYLPELIKVASDLGMTVNAISVPFDSIRGVNTLQELWSVEQIKRSELIKYWMAHGVRFDLAQSIHIDIHVEIGAGSFIGTGVHLLGDTKIGQECSVNAFSIIENTTIGDGSTVYSHSVIQDSIVGNNVNVGPFARLRSNTILQDSVEVGNFVEIKNSTLGIESKAKHLSYLGDAVIGKNVNIGAGTITCNYNGFKKDATTIEDNAFVGSNNTLIAPICIGKNSYTAAGSTITHDVPADALAIARARQVNKKGYAQKMRNKVNKCLDNTCQAEKSHNMNEEKEEEFQFRGAVKTEVDTKADF